MDLPVEHVRRSERPDLLPLTANSPEARHEGLPRHRALTARVRLGAMLDGGARRTDPVLRALNRCHGGGNHPCGQ